MNTSWFSKRQALLGTALLALMFFTPRDVRAVIFSSTDDPEFNTTEPKGDLAGSGWQYQGRDQLYKAQDIELLSLRLDID
jgi:hypothetical protein